MAKIQFPSFVSEAYKDSSLQVATSELINWFVENLDPENAKSPKVLKPTPGSTLFTSLSATGGIRGVYYTSTSRLFVVQSNQLFEVFSNGNQSYIGPINSYIGPVKMADNGFQLMLVDGSFGYILTFETNVLEQITSEHFPACNNVLYQDSFFIVNETGTNRFHISNSLNGLAWDGDYASAEGSADNISNLISNNREIWLFGPQSFEVWYNAGAPDFPYQRVPGSFSSIGLLAINSLTEINDVILFLGGNKDGFGIVYKSNGYSVQRVSTVPMEKEISNYPTQTDAIASTYLQDGHYFYCLSFQGGNTTWCYDLTTGKWHKRTSYSTVSNTEGRWNALYAVFAFDRILVANYSNGDLSQLSTSVYTENGSPIVRTRIAPHLNQNMNRLIYNSLQIDAQVGVGLGNTSGQGRDPVMTLSFSDDGGMTYGSSIPLSIGRVGQYKTQLKWNKLGSSRDRVFKIRTSDPINPVLINAYLDVVECLHG